jgi:hypothetical protein
MIEARDHRRNATILLLTKFVVEVNNTIATIAKKAAAGMVHGAPYRGAVR